MSKDLDIIKNLEYFKDIIDEYHISDDELLRNLNTLKRIHQSQIKCENCSSLESCKQYTKGSRLALNYQGIIVQEIEYCDYMLKLKQQQGILNKYVYCDVPAKLVDINMQNINYTAEQKQLYLKLGAILTNKEEKGLYICGDLGVGKTYLCIALANSLVLENEKVAFLKASNFFDEMRSLVSTDNLLIDKTINKLQRVKYLFIDDIGSESNSEYVRDKILFRILDYRLENHLTTIFTSNLNKKELLVHYQYDNKEKSNIMKAKRLLERIDKLTNNHVLDGPNLRK